MITYSDITAISEFLPHARAKILAIPVTTNQDKEFTKLSFEQQKCVASIHKSYGYLEAQTINYIQILKALLDNGHTLQITCPFSQEKNEINQFVLKIPGMGRIDFETHPGTSYPKILKRYFTEGGSENGFLITTRMNEEGRYIIDEVSDK